MKPTTFLFGLIAASCLADQATAQSQYSVVGVAEGDTLNMRAGIPETADFREAGIIGEIPPNASGILTTGVSFETEDGALWSEIRYGNVVGWVNAAYLTRDHSKDWNPDRLSCFGTEPFWNVEFIGEQATFSGLEREDTVFELLAAVRARNRRDIWQLQWLSPATAEFLTTVVMERDSCTDGMSDLNFGLEVLVQGLSDDERPLSGCCSWVLD
ncbi:MAG: hypothetical protein ACSHXD_15210 [Marinosulfonomonas sp.]